MEKWSIVNIKSAIIQTTPRQQNNPAKDTRAPPAPNPLPPSNLPRVNIYHPQNAAVRPTKLTRSRFRRLASPLAAHHPPFAPKTWRSWDSSDSSRRPDRLQKGNGERRERAGNELISGFTRAPSEMSFRCLPLLSLPFHTAPPPIPGAS